MADSVASSGANQRGWVVPSLAVIALVVLGLGYSLYQANQGAGALEKRVATLEAASGSATTLGADVAALKTQLSDLSTTLGDAPGKLAAFDARLASLEKAPGVTVPDLSGVTGDVTALKSGLAALKTQIGDVAPEQLAALKTQIDKVAASIPAPADTSQLSTTVAALDGEVQALQTQLAQITSTTTSAPPEPSAPLEPSAPPAAPSAPPVSSEQLATLQGDIDALKAKIAAVDIGPVSTALGDVKAQVDRLSTQVADLPVRSDLAALQSRLDEIANRPPPAVPPATDIAPLEADIGELKTRVAAVETSGKADADIVAALRTELDGLTGRVGAIESAGPNPELVALQTSLGDLKQEITALAAGSDLKALQAAVTDLQNQPKPVAALKPTLLSQIYFSRGSFKLSDAELAKLSELAAQLRDKSREVAVMGFSDTQGPAEFNRALSLKRASSVRKALLGYGIGASLITSISGLGEDGPPVNTTDNSPEQANRTVMIYANE
jgi:outer membrane protein OmpA-like peptidoglycan-associated protein